MKSKILGLLAVGLLAGPATANAAFVYSLSSNNGAFSGTSFVLRTESLISASTMFPLADFDSITFTGGAINSVFFSTPLGDAGVYFYESDAFRGGFLWDVAFAGPGTYCSGTVPCDESAAIMTISETAVPEPGSFALLSLGLAGLGLSRRKAA